MKKSAIFIITAGLIIGCSGSVQAVVVHLDCTCDLYGDPNVTQTCTFDYDLQELTITETWYELGFDTVKIGGRSDSPSTITVIRDITNNTGITWTGLTLSNDIGIGGGGYFVEGSAQTTKLQTITYPHSGRYQIYFSEPPPVLDGESFTIQFDFYSPNGFVNLFTMRPVPEPATFALLGIGTLVLLRSRRAARRKHKGRKSYHLPV